nr:PREDICTED: vegetative cell wall protein gp1-like [Bemisia tabaci]
MAIRKNLTTTCYNEIPISYNNNSMFLSPRTRVLTHRGTELDCTNQLPVKFQIDNHRTGTTLPHTLAKPPTVTQAAPPVFKRPYLKPRCTRPLAPAKVQYCKLCLPVMKRWSMTYCPICCQPEDRNKPFKPIPICSVVPDPNFKPSFIPPLSIFMTQITELPPPSAPPSQIPHIALIVSYVFPLSPASIAAISLPPSPPHALSEATPADTNPAAVAPADSNPAAASPADTALAEP